MICQHVSMLETLTFFFGLLDKVSWVVFLAILGDRLALNLLGNLLVGLFSHFTLNMRAAPVPRDFVPSLWLVTLRHLPQQVQGTQQIAAKYKNARCVCHTLFKTWSVYQRTSCRCRPLFN